MLTAFISALKTPDLRKKILFTLAMIAVYRAGATLPSPGVNYQAITTCINETSGTTNDVYTLLNPGKGVPTLSRCAEFGKMHVHHGKLAHPELPRF